MFFFFFLVNLFLARKKVSGEFPYPCICTSFEGVKRERYTERKLFSHLVSHGNVNLYFVSDGRSGDG